MEVTHGMLMPVRIKTTFAVSDCGENLILGWPWLKQHGLTRFLVIPTEAQSVEQPSLVADDFASQEPPTSHVEVR